METKGYYAAVGFFVLILSAIGIVIALWLSVGLNTQNYTNYTIYEQESVTGLSVSGSVKYNGVDVGVVKKIELDLVNPNLVLILVAIEEGTPINTATRATLKMQGVTGIAYIELSGGDPRAQPLTAKPGQQYPIIPSEPSLLFRMDAAIDSLTESLQKITDNLGTLFNQKNKDLLQETLGNLNASTQHLSDLIGSAQVTLQQGNDLLQDIHNQVLPQTMDLLGNVDGLTLHLDEFIQQLSDNPSMLIRGKAPALLGPGETSPTQKRRN